MFTFLVSFTPTIQGIVVCTRRGSLSRSDGRSAYAGHIRRCGLFGRSGRLPRGAHSAKRERCSWDVFSFHDEASASSLEHRKREGCAILVASCSGTLCQSLLEKGLAKDQLLETVPDATRSGMAIETGEPIPEALPPPSCEGAFKAPGVRAIPADHDVYPVG